MTKMSPPDLMLQEHARMLSLGIHPVPQAQPHPYVAAAMACPPMGEERQPGLNLEALTGMKSVQPMRIHRYRRG